MTLHMLLPERARPTLRRSLLAAAIALSASHGSACGEVPIPEHITEEQVKSELAAADPARLLEGGTRVFFEDFERQSLGDKWVIERIASEANPGTWTIEGGWLRNRDAKNQGAWVKALPEKGDVRIEFLAVSDKPASGRFPGDLKCEAFATDPAHEKGYSFINGGWNNQFDTIAKLGEHSADDKRKPALPVVEGKVHKFAVILDGTDLHLFRDGSHLYTYPDPRPVRGPWFGFNNWLSNARFDELAVYTF
jgi:hypothetical protein